MKYSFNLPMESIAFAQKAEINASYKDLSAACAAIRYMKASRALNLLDSVIAMGMPIEFRRNNKHMGSRHELGGRKGAYPVKAAREVREVLVNAIANANNKGMPGENLFIVHAAANKTHIERRYPSKGSISWGKGMYGRAAIVHSDLEYAKVEIGIASGDEKGIIRNIRYFIKKKNKPAAGEAESKEEKEKTKEEQKEEQKGEQKKEQQAEQKKQ